MSGHFRLLRLRPTSASVSGVGMPCILMAGCPQRYAPLFGSNGAGPQPLGVACSTLKQLGAAPWAAMLAAAVRPPPVQSVCLSAASYTHLRVRSAPQLCAETAKISHADHACTACSVSRCPGAYFANNCTSCPIAGLPAAFSTG